MILPKNPLVLMGPAILLVFSGCFFLFWISNKNKRYLLLLSGAITCFCLGLLAQILSVPKHAGANAVLTAIIYTISVSMTCDGLLRRSGKYFSSRSKLIYSVTICLGISYFYFVERNLFIRIYILNFGLGLIFTQTCYKLRHLRTGRTTEKIFFWVFVAFTSQFFVRTLFTTQNVQRSGVGDGFPLFWFVLQFSVAVLGVALALSILAIIVDDKVEALDQDRFTDHQTKLLNRRGFIKAAEKVSGSCPLSFHSLLMIDIDHFKHINDTYGHATGDIVISEVAKIIADVALLKRGIACRWGGEEFAVLLPECDHKLAYPVAESIRLQVANMSNKHALLPKVTVSIGLATQRREETLVQMMDVADCFLYQAKQRGRNRTEF